MTALLLSAVLLQSDDPHMVVQEVLAALSVDEPKERQPRPRRVLMFTADWCYACKAGLKDFGPWLEKSGWQIDETEAAHCQLIDADERPDLVRKYRVATLPTFVLIDGDKELRRTGYAGRMTIPTLWGGK